MSSFKDLRVVDNFYQTSSFFPMPTLSIGTRNEDGSMNLGSYSLCFPYYIAGKEYYAMLLECRNNSNTCQNILRTGRCAINFMPDDKKTFKEMVRLGYPGPSAEKMKDCKFEFEDGLADPADPNRPQVNAQAFQVFECTWDSSLENGGKYKPGEMDGYEPPYNDFNGITSKFGAHFILIIDKVLIKPQYYDAIFRSTTVTVTPRTSGTRRSHALRSRMQSPFQHRRKWTSSPFALLPTAVTTPLNSRMTPCRTSSRSRVHS